MVQTTKQGRCRALNEYEPSSMRLVHVSHRWSGEAATGMENENRIMHKLFTSSTLSSLIVLKLHLLQMLLVERCMREVYVFTHVCRASQWPLLGCWPLPVKSATIQCSCFALLCNPHNAVLCTPAHWVRLAWRDAERVKQNKMLVVGVGGAYDLYVVLWSAFLINEQLKATLWRWTCGSCL